MFTGLVETMGAVLQIEQRPPGVRLQIQAPSFDGVAMGDSIAING